MSEWRVIITDSEAETGVAPVCPFQDRAGELHDLIPDDLEPSTRFDTFGVYDCCPGPHIECFSEKAAGLIARALTEAEAVECS